MYRILAVAVGDDNSATFPNPITSTTNLTNVRPYIYGLIDGLGNGYGLSIGNPNYDIWYRECPVTTNPFNQQNDLIFTMSTNVTMAAINYATTSGTSNPIVFPTGSNFTKDLPAGKSLPQYVAGIDAQRDQGDMLVKNFKQAWSPLTTLYYLHLNQYGPSERGKSGLQGAAKSNGITTLNELKMYSSADLATQLASLSKVQQDGHTGLLVLPIDFCLGQGDHQAPSIIQAAQVTQKLPTFFPIPDWAHQTTPTPIYSTAAFGAWGLSQYLCGRLASDLVYEILWGGKSPKTYGIVPAPLSLFDLVVNQTAADRLKISLPKHLKRQVRP